MVNRQTAWKWTIALGFAVIAGYFIFPDIDTQNVIYLVLGIASVAGIFLGMYLHRPVNRVGWTCVALAGACFTLGDAVLTYPVLAFNATLTSPSIADALYLLGYPFLIVGIIRLTRGPRHDYLRESFADAAVISLGVLALSWDLLMDSYVHNGTLSLLGVVVNMAYPMMDILVLFFLVRSFLSRTTRPPYQNVLTLAVFVMFVADFVYDVLTLHNAYTSGNAVDGLFLVEYVLVAAAALHPSVSVRGAPDVVEAAVGTPDEARSSSRLPLVIVAGFIPPVILVVKTGLGVPVNVIALSSLSIAVFGVICWRLAWMFGRIGDQAHLLEANAHEMERKVVELESAHQARDQLEATLRYQAFHDELTGLANRALLHDRVEQALHAATRTGESVALCLGDLDGFKTINDTLGHHEGDILLGRVARLIESIVRPGDTVARLGGDEFAVLMIGVTSQPMAEHFAERIVALLRDSTEVGGFLSGISVGVAFASSATSVEQLISEADTAMYAAKASGKNRIAVFEPPMRDLVVERLDLISAFHGSLERSEFVLEYQPLYSLADGRLRSFEALVRWNHPDPRPHPTRHVHTARRGDRVHRPVGPMDHGGGMRAAHSMGEQGGRGHRGRHQRLPTATRLLPAPSRHPGRRADHGRRSPPRGPRGHRERTHARSRTGGVRPEGAAGARLPDLHRRLRDGLLVVELPADVSRRHPQDRQVLRRPPRSRIRRRTGNGHGDVHRRPRPRTRSRGRGGRHRDRPPAEMPHRTRLRLRTGLPLLPTGREQ